MSLPHRDIPLEPRRGSTGWLPRLLVAAVTCSLPSCGEERPAGTEVPLTPQFSAIQTDLLGAGNSYNNAWADMDGDGDLDLFVGFRGADKLYRNDGGVLTDVARDMGLVELRRTLSAAWGDYDRDGDPDLFLGLAGSEDGAATALLRNDGDQFTDVTEEAGIRLTEGSTRQAAWVDYDGDGDLDAFLGLRDRANVLFRNEGGRFQEIAQTVGVADPRRTVGALWFDYEQDGDLDLLVTNMDGDPNGLFRNDGGQFTDVAEAAGVADGGRGIGDNAFGTVRPCVVDYDRDGWMDLFMANYGPNALFRNKGDGTFENVAEAVGVAIDSRYDTCIFGDYDLDGRIDLYVNGTVGRDIQYRDYLFRNTGQGFEDVTPSELLGLSADHGAQWVDFDQDGDLDLSLTGAADDGMHYVMRNSRNNEDAGSSIQVMVVDGSGNATRAGAEVRVYRAGTSELLGAQVLDSGSGYNSQGVTPLHFGLPDSGSVDVEVIFPGAGSRHTTRLEGIDPKSVDRGHLTIGVGS